VRFTIPEKPLTLEIVRLAVPEEPCERAIEVEFAAIAKSRGGGMLSARTLVPSAIVFHYIP